MGHLEDSNYGKDVATSLVLVAAAGAALVSCGGKAVVDGTSGAGGQGGAAATTGTTVAPPTTSGTTTPTPSTACGRACLDLWSCTQQDDLCPGLEGASVDAFLAYWVPLCEASPAFIALVEASADCPTMVTSFSAVRPDFESACLGEDQPVPGDEGR